MPRTPRATPRKKTGPSSSPEAEMDGSAKHAKQAKHTSNGHASPSAAAPAPGETTTTITATTHLTLPAHPKKLSYDELNPRSKPVEFFGPIGCTFVLVACPLIAYALFFTCNELTGCPPRTSAGWHALWRDVGNWPSVKGHFWDWHAAGVYLAWYFYLIAAWVLLPGEWVEGYLCRDGTKKKYKLNGFNTLVLTFGLAVGVLLQPNGIYAFTYVYDHWVPLVSAALAMSLFQAFFVYINSFFSGELLAEGGNSGNFIYDFFLGRPLNPTFPGFPNFDIKTFNEVRPGIILWPLLNVACACEQYIRFGKITDSMWLVLAFEAFYSLDSLWFEFGILSQMDITTDGFGYMLSFGDLVWVPFVYGLQARYLAFHPVVLGPVYTALIIALNLTGVWIFRQANSEKLHFRNGKNPKNLSFIETQRGTKLLISGWWGVSRHPNYLGDWIMALSWCLPTGFNTPITYFYFAFFVVLLLHRQHRDDEACRKKYGRDWDRYCGLVPWKIIPFVY